MRTRLFGLLLFSIFATPMAVAAQVDARMFRQPDVSGTHITFVYAGDIWIVPKEGGTASRLSSPPGEESFPRFSPDGSRIAFTGNYDGNEDVYTIPTFGGEPIRLTYHPMADRTVDWYPDGSGVLFASSRESGRQRFNQFFKVAPTGGVAERLPLEMAEYGAVSPDGRTLAFMMIERDSRTWKRYRGGRAPDIWTFDLQTYESRNVTDDPANDSHPMWHGDTLYFLSDRGDEERHNIWAREADGTIRQVTTFADFDITWPSSGPSDIVFQAGGTLYRLELPSEALREVNVEVVTDLATLKPRIADVGDQIQFAAISPTGQRAVFQARGDVFTVPAEHGVVRNLTRTSGVAERTPTWSPDGRQVAYWSDGTGEYELTVRAADGSGEPRTLTSLGAGFRYTPFWSPDSKRIAFMDNAGRLQVHDLDSGTTREVQKSEMWVGHGQAAGFWVSWSPDSRWLAYSMSIRRLGSAIYLYDTNDGQTHQVTAGYYNDYRPVFDPDGKYLYLFTNRHLQPVYGDMDQTWVYPNSTEIAAVALARDVPSPLAPRNDEEGKEEAAEGQEDAEAPGTSQESVAVPATAIDLGDFEARLVVLPPEAGNYTTLEAAKGKVVYLRRPRSGSSDDVNSTMAYWDLKEREEKTVLADVNTFWVSADGKKALVSSRDRWAIVDLAPDRKMDEPLRTADMETLLDPRAEWRQMFTDAWRMVRDYFYDPGLHGVDWQAMRRQYGELLDDAVTRWDVNFVIGELIGELNSSHTYRGGGDLEEASSRAVGLLGVDWTVDGGAYRIAHILRGAPWDNEARSPLLEPGVDVREGEYVLAVNGIPLDVARDPYAPFQGLAGRTVTLTVGSSPSGSDARDVLVETLRSETRLRHLAWIEKNRQHVDEASDGKVGYIYVRSTGIDGQTELVRQFAAQYDRDALVVDERFNSGGQIPDRFIELLNRPRLAYWAVRDGEDWQWPPISQHGYQAMLINGWSGSGGDAFPYYFRETGLGPLIGTRTWGGLIGISGNPQLIDGGFVRVPTFRMYGTDGQWFAEGYGVAPDIEVPEDPTALARGEDPQLDRAIQELLTKMREAPVVTPDRPEYEDRTVEGKKKTATESGSR